MNIEPRTCKEKNILALIKELKSEHLEIFDALKEVKELGIFTHQGYTKLISARESLFEHLRKEDEKLYTVLYKIAEQNKKYEEKLDLFAIDLEYIIKVVLKFFNTYNKEIIETKSMKEFEYLFLVLNYRMKNEEDFLYSMYEEMGKL